MKNLLLLPCLALAAALTGCQPSSEWIERNDVPTTDAERAAIAAHVEKILAATPRSLAGHDQDWDDAINAAERQARVSLSRTTLWEFRHDGFGGGQYTGRWKYAEEAK